MRARDRASIKELSTPEKILLVEDLWDEIASEEIALAVPRSHKEELDRRLQKHLSGKGKMLSLDELRSRIERRK